MIKKNIVADVPCLLKNHKIKRDELPMFHVYKKKS